MTATPTLTVDSYEQLNDSSMGDMFFSIRATFAELAEGQVSA